MKKLLAVLLAALMLMSFSALAEEEGFEEFPIGEEQDVGPDNIIHIAAVYFQPVVMEPASEAGLTVEEANIYYHTILVLYQRHRKWKMGCFRKTESLLLIY